ncbi:sulfotransferase 1B1-like [Saccostrea echinata]|uniref:sulfotransferase 1B1-like n=1 Tax=Saccostrea echinata TaxID=191078 RepID=UPI002A81F05C|nr:sulfotransferase 1B1-like [Saccostrea echinata]
MEQNGEGKPKQPVIFDGMALPPFPPLVKDAKGRFEEIRDLHCRKDDVLLVIYPKSGTHWVWEIVCMLLKKKAEYMKETKEFFFLEAIPDMSVVHNLASPRPLNTHVPYRWLPKQHIENGGKIVHVLRNPKDVAVSMFHHFNNTKEFGEPIDFKTFYERVFMGPVPLFGGWFSYEKEFEQAEAKDTRSAIFTLHYESLKKNPIQETKRLAKFLDVDLSDEVLAEIVDKCSFKKLKEANDTMKDFIKIVPGKTEVNPQEIMSKLYRKGEIGDWKNHFTVALNEHFDAVFKEEMKDSKIQVQYE